MKAVHALVVLTSTLLTGCLSVQGYDGPKRETDELARISGDPSISTGSPLALVLRKVDEQTLNVAQTSVDVLPGKHTLLVDCRISEGNRTTRHTIEVEVEAGVHYHLAAETAPGLTGCAEVSLESR
ncbi:MAG: hypothetical protein ABW106_00095 [Steroidobacteraceae bacterium]